MPIIYMPSLIPIPIKTASVPWYKRIFVWATSPRTWRVAKPYYFPWKGVILMIPKGFVFDGASVPRLLWPLLSPMGILLIPGLFHDFGYKYQCYMNSDGEAIFYGKPQKFFDKNFKEMGESINKMTPQDWIAWGALRIAGRFAWNAHRRENKKVSELFQK